MAEEGGRWKGKGKGGGGIFRGGAEEGGASGVMVAEGGWDGGPEPSVDRAEKGVGWVGGVTDGSPARAVASCRAARWVAMEWKSVMGKDKEKEHVSRPVIPVGRSSTRWSSGRLRLGEEGLEKPVATGGGGGERGGGERPGGGEGARRGAPPAEGRNVERM